MKNSQNKDVSQDNKNQNYNRKQLKEYAETEIELSVGNNEWAWKIDIDSNYTFASADVTNIFGCKPEEIIGKSFFEIIPDENAKRMEYQFRKISLKGKPGFIINNCSLAKNGNNIIHAISGAPVFDKSGKKNGYRVSTEFKNPKQR